MEVSLFELRNFYKEYLIDHNLDNKSLQEIKDKLDITLQNENEIYESIVLYSYLWYKDYTIVYETKYDFLNDYWERFHRYDNTNFFENDKEMKRLMKKAPNKKVLETIKKAYYYNIYEKIKDREI